MFHGTVTHVHIQYDNKRGEWWGIFICIVWVFFLGMWIFRIYLRSAIQCGTCTRLVLVLTWFHPLKVLVLSWSRYTLVWSWSWFVLGLWGLDYSSYIGSVCIFRWYYLDNSVTRLLFLLFMENTVSCFHVMQECILCFMMTFYCETTGLIFMMLF